MAFNPKSKLNLQMAKKGEVKNPKGRGNSKNTKTILERFLNIEIDQKNPFTHELEKMSVLELMNLKQIANALEGDLQAFKEIIDRYEGKISNKLETDIKTNGESLNNVLKIEVINPKDESDSSI